MIVTFTKMHGCGNDFVVIDATRDLRDWRPTPSQAAFLLDPNFGIGGDQLLLLYPAHNADARMVIMNPDGSEAEMCGNGIRCCAMYMLRHGLTVKRELVIATLAGLIRPAIEGEQVRVNMGAPRLDASEIPVADYTGQVVAQPLPSVTPWPCDYSLPPMTCVSMGNPHAVFFVSDVTTVPLADIGPLIEHHPVFPRRTNVEFAQVLNRARVRMRVWERGAGVTLACGTGACAMVVAGI